MAAPTHTIKTYSAQSDKYDKDHTLNLNGVWTLERSETKKGPSEVAGLNLDGMPVAKFFVERLSIEQQEYLIAHLNDVVL